MNRKFMNLVYSRKRLANRPFITFRHLSRARFAPVNEYSTKDLLPLCGLGLYGGTNE